MSSMLLFFIFIVVLSFLIFAIKYPKEAIIAAIIIPGIPPF